MLNISDHTYVKGFTTIDNTDEMVNPKDCQGEFFAIITDLTITDKVRVFSATKAYSGKWLIKCSDGKEYLLYSEPATPHIMEYGILAKDSPKSKLGYAPVFHEDYPKAMDDINISKDGDYFLIGYVNKDKVETSELVKFWIDEGKNHCLTKSGTHYIF